MKRVVEMMCLFLLITSCQTRENQKTVPLDESNTPIQLTDTPGITAPPTGLNLDPLNWLLSEYSPLSIKDRDLF